MTEHPASGSTVPARELVEEACRKSAMAWVQTDHRAQALAVWHVWFDGAMYVVSGGREQAFPPATDGDRLVVTVRSKDKGSRLVTWVARSSVVEPGSELWDAAVPELHGKRLNPPDGEEQPSRWARESVVTRLEPTGELLEAPGRMSTASHAAPPPGSPATTRGALPFVVGRRARRRR
ncbi:MAG: hypothetical protein ACXV2H_13460 [Actinomycetes bacterium]